MLNSNIGCFEIDGRECMILNRQKLNSNIGCFEMSLKDSSGITRES